MKFSETDAFKRLKRIVESSKAVDTEAFIKDIETLHTGRSVRSLTMKGMGTRKLVDANLQDQSYRSRLVEILLSTTKYYYLLDAAYHATTEKLMIDFNARLLESGYRSIADRQAFVRSKLRFAAERIAEFSMVVELANLVVKDIDQAGFSLKRTVETLTLATKPEVIVQG